jgi:hypothetical protein
MKRPRNSLVADLGFIILCALMIGVAYGTSARAFATAALFGGFAAYLVLFDSDPTRRHGSIARMLAGVAFGLSVCAIYRASLVIWMIAAGLGAVLGFVGAKWARHV